MFAHRRPARSFLTDERGGIVIIGAVALPIVLGVAALVGEFGLALVTKSHNQRVSDLAAYAGAIAYSKTKSEADMQAAARKLATLNGVATDKLVVRLVDSPRTGGAKAVSVGIRTTQPLFLARVLDYGPSVNIGAGSLAEVGVPSQSGCMLALSEKETGIALSGGTQITAANCVVSSNSTLTLPCGTKITTIGANYYSSTDPSICPWQPTLVTPAGVNVVPVKVLTADPLAGNSAVAEASARFAAVNRMTAPSAPAPSTGGSIEFAWDQNKTKSQAVAVGCSASWAQPLWTFTCTGKTSVNLGTITLGGGINVDFNVNGAANVTYNFSGSITNSGSKMQFGPGTYNIAKGLTTGGGSTTTFGAGTFRIGTSDNACNGGAKVSICNTSSLSFGGPSAFELTSGFMNTGGSNLTLGSGKANSFKLGPSSTGDAIIIGGGSKTIMGDASTGSGVFEVAGNINGGGGGSCLVIPASAQHDIDGDFIGSGNILLGAGIYSIDGYFALGLNGGGGGASCNGTTSVTGENVTLVLSGIATAKSGSCNGYVFCIAAGYSGVRLVAPTSGTMAKLAVIGPQNAARTGGALFTEGGSNGIISGAFYFPHGPLIMSGGANTAGLATGACFHPIASRITLSGGTSQVSECIKSSSSAASKVAIIQ